MKDTQYRQGDVFIERVSIIPKTATKQAVKGAVILAEGEATGHAHAIRSKSVSLYRTPELATYIEVEEAVALLEHEEHSTIALGKGMYRVKRQREYSPEAIRNVAD